MDPLADQLLLCLDASSEQAGVGLFGRGHEAETIWLAGRAQTVTLLAQIHHLLALHGLGPADLGGVAVASGPGTFNGLRVGMSVAKGLVLALDLPIWGVDTLAIAATPWLAAGTPVIATVAAGRGRLVWTEFRADADGPAFATEARNTTPDALIAAVRERAGRIVVTGELAPAAAAALEALDQVVVPPASLRVRRPGALAWLAAQRRARGETDDVVTLEPRYLGR